jgi:hypothetical protein
VKRNVQLLIVLKSQEVNEFNFICVCVCLLDEREEEVERKLNFLSSE